MTILKIETLDDLEDNFDLFAKAQIPPENSPTLNKIVRDFVEILSRDPEFAKKAYPKVYNVVITRIKEKKPSEDILTLQTHVEKVDVYIKNALNIPSTAIKTLKRLENEYKAMLGGKFDGKVLLWIECNKDSIQKALSLVQVALGKQKTKPNITEGTSNKLIFRNQEDLECFFDELKGFFPEKEDELWKALKGELQNEKLLFPHNANRFVEIFRRLQYNGFLISILTEIRNWICDNFQYIKARTGKVTDFNPDSTYQILKEKRISKK